MFVFQRHPRFSIFTVVLIFGTLLLLASHAPESYVPHMFQYDRGSMRTLNERLQIAENIYQRMIAMRHGLIQKFGPTPKDIYLFPPVEPPYYPYTVWDFFPAAFNCPFEVERVGALGDGGKWMCGLSRVATKSNCVVYSFGINGESSFEAEILSRTESCQVWGYDFSVSSFGPQIAPEQSPRTHFFAWGLAGEDAHSASDNPPMYTLSTLMEMNGHTHIDILKIDIEGWEFQTLATLFKTYRDLGRPLPFSQLQLEIHAWNMTFAEYLKWWEQFEELGLRPFWTEPNEVYANYNRGKTPDLAEYSFINIRGDHELVSEFPRPRGA